MKKVLITGGIGQIGSYLVDTMHDNYDVTVLDNLSSGKEPDLPSNVSFVKDDIRSPIARELASQNDIIIHTAAQISVAHSMSEPLFDADNNVFGTLNLLEGARSGDIERFVYISSAAVYGDPQYLPIDEKHPQNPMSPYGASKLCGEKYCSMYHHAYGLPTVSIRPFNIYSPRQDPSNPYSGVISKFIGRLKEGLPPIIFGDGSNTRDFVSAHDVVDMITLLANGAGGDGDVYNVGTGMVTRIDELAQILMDIFDNSMDIEYKDPMTGDIKHSSSCITMAKAIGFEPKINLYKGLEEIIG
ncbi:NAD-dependent epimerase/dehydratase family protein [Methanolobus sediminis]|uniref:NAD-dependent epimerase/dehydratase family protein n=1 Tax=Methanolobus sediminis TaxID=3072978 RepID=A0AA51YJC5_9EURY|nr:NAD-dependent epimerase/dehydratase family protein [Methanolobus sediminis]WMW25420.1 NAD-dependent epimerase/dehydratase family protein [Methanolobus sediminis]